MSKHLLFLTIAVFGLLYSCNKNRDQDQNPNILPAATQSGANTGGALVDGRVFVSKIETPDYNPGGNNTQYVHVNGEYNLQVVLRQADNTSNRMVIYITDTAEITTKTYELSNSNGGGYTYNTLTNYNTNDKNKGNFTITKFDKTSQIISGTFSFQAKNLDGKIVTITEGRFDKRFTY